MAGRKRAPRREAETTGLTTLHPPRPRTGRLTLPFLDGLRGLAALTVAIYHTYLFTGNTNQTLTELPRALHPLRLGNLAVPAFIVLSGFVLMAPIVLTGRLSGGSALGFLKRRARRILPPYYIALLMFGALIAAVPALTQSSGTAWDSKVPVSFWNAVSHIFLVHNVNSHWAVSIDGPLWSIAAEWQIYILMPFVLLPTLRRFGNFAALSVAFGIGYAPRLLFGSAVDFAHPWFVGCFAIGMLAAQVALDETRWTKLRKLCSPKVVAALVIASGFAAAVEVDRVEAHLWVTEVAMSLLCAMGIIALTQSRSRVRRLLESRSLVALGGFSYSIYLIHSPILGFINLAALHLPLSLGVRFVLMLGLALPVALIASRLFYLVVERPIMQPRNSEPAAKTFSASASARLADTVSRGVTTAGEREAKRASFASGPRVR